jgi:L-asparaginase II
MVATCKVNDWDLARYENPAHPLQIAIKNEFEKVSGEAITRVGVDGCGAPLFAISLTGLATGIRNLMLSDDPVHQEVVSACRANPVMVSGIGRLPTVLMEKVDGLFVKDGAEGVMVIGTRSGEVIVWKMSDGSQRGAMTLALASLSHLGVNVAGIEREMVLGGGEVVGEIRASKIVRHG